MSTATDVVCLELLSRSLGPACSNVTHFVLEERTRLYRAYGVSGGTVIVQAVQVRGTSHKEEPIETIVVIGPYFGLNPKANDVELVEWGGGQDSLIAIATSEAISVCSLSFQFDQQKAGKSGQGPTAGFHYLANWETTSKPISLAWTQDASGLVVLEDTGHVACALISTRRRASEGKAADPLVKTSGRVLDKTSLRAQGDSVYADIEGVWSGVAPYKQSIVSAGPSLADPVATAGMSNSVIVWWPDSSGRARQERLKHPCAVLGLDWSEATRDAPTSMLLSICRDGVVRIWGKLDVGPHDLSGKEVPTPEQLPVFCLMVVLEPPLPVTPPEQGSQAVWVKPAKGKTPGSDFLWVVTAHCDNAVTKDMQISLWGIDDVPSGAPGACQGPRAVPWGSTNVPGGLLDISRLAAFMIFPQPALELMLVESTWNTCGTSAESKVSLLHCGSFRMSKAVHRSFVIDGPLSSVQSLAVHSSLDLICTINVELCAAVWDVWPVHCLAHIRPGSVSLHRGIQCCQWVDKSLVTRDFVGFLLLAGSDGAVLCSVSLDLSSLTHDFAKIDVLASVPLPEGMTSVTNIVPISSTLEENEQVWFMLWDSGKSTTGHILHIQVQDDKCGSISFPHAQIPLNTGNASVTMIGNCWHHPIMMSGDSQGCVWAHEIDLEKGRIALSAECKLGANKEVVGVIQSLAACRYAPYVICTTELGPEGQEDTVWVLQSQSTGEILKYVVDARIELPSTSADVAWVHGCSMVLAFVVCYESGDAQVWIRSRTGSWEAAAQFSIGLPISSMGTMSHGLPVVAAGKHLLVLSCSSDAIHQRYFLGDSIAGCSLVAGGTLSDYHPDHLRILMEVGFLDTVHAIGHSLAEWLRQAATGDARVALTVLGPGATLIDLVGEDLISTKFNWLEPADLGNHVPFSPLAAQGMNLSNHSATVTAKAGETGLLDMSSFGRDIGGNLSHGTGTHHAVESGVLDMGAFGIDASPPPPSPPPAGIESGMLDMGAFGLDTPAPPPAPTQPSSGLESGMLDMGAFGFDAAPLSAPPPQPPAVVASGIMDKKVFGDGRSSKEEVAGAPKEGGSSYGPSVEKEREPCLPLKGIDVTWSSHPDGNDCRLPKDIADFLLSFVPDKSCQSTEIVGKAAALLGLTESELSDVCEIIAKQGSKMPDSASRLDRAGKKAFMGVSLSSVPVPDTNTTGDVPTDSSMQFPGAMSMSRPISYQSLPSTGASLSTAFEAEGAGDTTSWSRKVGLNPGINASHLLWATQSETQADLLSCCVEATKKEETTSASTSQTAVDFMSIRRTPVQECGTAGSWEELKSIGAGFWLRDPVEIAKLFEDLARLEFAKDRDPHSCALLYVALKKERMLSTLFRGAGHPRAADLLGKDFTIERNQEELLPEAVTFRDRGAQALLLWGIGKQAEALLALADVPSTQGLSLSRHTAASEVSLLQFALVQGLPHLEGRYIPVSLLKKLQGQATVCAHILGVYGMPLLALQVLGATSGLRNVTKCSSRALDTLLKDWELRLLTGVMVRHLPAPQAVSAREPYLIAWHEHVKSDLALLKEHGFVADSDAVIASLEGLMEALFEVPSRPIHKRSYSSQPNLAYTRDKPPVSGSSSAVLKGRHQLCQHPRELLHVDGDRCAGVCCSHEAEVHGPTPPHIHRVAVGTSRHGMHYVDWGPSTSTDGGEMKNLLQLHRWPKNRWLTNGIVRKTSAGSAVAPRELNTGPLVSHPFVGLFLSGGNTEAVNLWRFGESSPCANFIPTLSRDSAMRGWESPRRMCWNASGDRLAAVGMDGSCATWQLDAGARTEAGGVAGCSEMVVPRRGGDIKFVDGSGSILAVSGEDEHGHGSIRLWDTLSPRGAGRIIHEFEGTVNHLATIPSNQILVSAFNSGAVAAHDLRMLRDGPATPLWSLPAHNGSISSVMIGWGPFGSYETWDLVLATGGKDGDVCVIDQLLETARVRQRIQKAHWRKSGHLSGLIMSGLKGNLGISASSRTSNRVKSPNAVGATVLDLEWCDEGLVSSGADGVVLLFPWESTAPEPN